jgi:hypothetical protein
VSENYVPGDGSPGDLVAWLEATYRAIDRELRAYSQAANAGSLSAAAHYAEAERLRGVAREITARLAGEGRV